MAAPSPDKLKQILEDPEFHSLDQSEKIKVLKNFPDVSALPRTEQFKLIDMSAQAIGIGKKQEKRNFLGPISGPVNVGAEFLGDVFLEGARGITRSADVLRQEFPSLTKFDLPIRPEILEPTQEPKFPAARNIERFAEFALLGGRVKAPIAMARSMRTLAGMGSRLGDAAVIGAIEKSQGGEFTTGAGLALLSAPIEGAVRGLFKLVNQHVPRRAMMALIRPTEQYLRFGKDPAMGVFNERLTGLTRRRLLDNIRTRRRQIGSMMNEVLGSSANANKKIDITPAKKILDKAIIDSADIGKSSTEALLAFKDKFLSVHGFRNGKLVAIGRKETLLTPLELQRLKRNLGNSISWTEDAVEKGVNEIRHSVHTALDNLLKSAVPRISKLNSRYANMLSAEKSLEKSLLAAEKSALFSIGLPELGVGSVFGLLSGSASLGAGITAFLGFKSVRQGLSSAPFHIGVARATREWMDPEYLALLPRAIRDTVLSQITGEPSGLPLNIKTGPPQPGEQVQATVNLP